ncbi:MAG: nuclear transport factor 2 family protein [Acidobacteriota bacterium]|nr:nuclear transport factor 2 family protein [Blastocatellia bacterium]MDW8238873.1 nuclear transport factor 2 family protein [Acidobacteriota bacterium]
MTKHLVILLLILTGPAPMPAQTLEEKCPGGTALMVSEWSAPMPAQTLEEKRLKMSAAEEAVRMAQIRRFEAMMRGQVKLLERLLDDDLTYTHSSGIVDTKADLLHSLQAGAIRYDSIEADDIQIRLYGQTAVVTGQARMKVRRQGQPLDFRVRFTEVYVKRNNQWLLIAWQSTEINER